MAADLPQFQILLEGILSSDNEVRSQSEVSETRNGRLLCVLVGKCMSLWSYYVIVALSITRFCHAFYVGRRHVVSFGFSFFNSEMITSEVMLLSCCEVDNIIYSMEQDDSFVKP